MDSLVGCLPLYEVSRLSELVGAGFVANTAIPRQKLGVRESSKRERFTPIVRDFVCDQPL